MEIKAARANPFQVDPSLLGYTDRHQVDADQAFRIYKMKKAYLAALFFVVAIGFSANSSAVTVKGMISCRVWLKNHAAKVAPSSMLADNAWLVGYLSGVAVARNIDFLKGVDDSTIQTWMHNYCSSHPSDLVGYAADALSVELVKRMH
jgi:hypothetical protein